ncbi:hypothetical protein RB653_006632 [Dictyostelium firmibasis]|uniref:FNIP repeat-containing protein n=1 Tax=Dictyostelium firmibasis TaxID=79012 RepID=A0AAN7TME7_9MYCE
MEKNLLNWLFLKGNSNNDWILEHIKKLSENGLHISLKSLYLYCKFQINFNEEEKLVNSYLIKELEQIKSLKDNSEFVYSRHDNFMKKKINELETCSTKEAIDKFTKNLLISLDIIRNNKKLLIKNENFNLNSKFNNESGEIFLNSIWRNSIIKEKVIYFLSVFKNNRFKKKFTSIKELNQYRFKDFLDHVELSLSTTNNNNEDSETINEYLENQLPCSIRKLQINSNYYYRGYYYQGQPYKRYIKPLSIPPSVIHLDFSCHDEVNCQIDLKYIDFNLPILNNDFFKKNEHQVYKKLYFSSFESKIDIGIIPEGVEFIDYTTSSNPIDGLLNSNQFPKSLKTLNFKRMNNWDIIKKEDLNCIQSLPITISNLYYDTNSILEPKFFPESITILKLGNTSFTYSNETIKVGVLPSRLIELDLGSYFNEIEENVLPSTLKSLTLCDGYIKTIKPGCLPNSLEYLSFHGDDTVVPKINNGMQYLTIKSVFKKNQPCLIKGSLPIGLKTLKLSSRQSFLDILVPEVITKSHTSLNKISIIQHKIYDYQDQIELTEDEINLKINNWKNLKFKLPSSVKIVKYFSNRFFQFLDNSLPLTHFKTHSKTEFFYNSDPATALSLKMCKEHVLSYNNHTGYKNKKIK